MPPYARQHPAYEPTDPPPAPASTFAKAAKDPLARRLALIVAAATAITGVLTAASAGVVNVIGAVAEANARKSNVEIDRRLDAIETRVNGGFGLPLEADTRRLKDEEIDREIVRLRARLNAIEAGSVENAVRAGR